MLRGLFYNLWPFCIWPYCDISINYQLKKNVLIQINLGIYSFMYTLLKWCECLWSFERDHPWKWQSQSYFDFLQGGFKTITHDGYTRTAKKLLQILLNMIKQQQQHQQKVRAQYIGIGILITDDTTKWRYCFLIQLLYS